MRFGRTLVAILLLTLATFFLYQISTNLPRFQGQFHWEKVEIMMSAAPGSSDLEVYESIRNMTKVFQLEPGDECYFLTEEDWIWRDIKDPAFALAPVFARKKAAVGR